MKINQREKIYQFIFFILAFSSLFFLLAITITLIKEGLPIFGKINFFNFVFGKFWYPTYEPPEFGILPLILGSIWITLTAMVICVPLGIGTALYIHEIAKEKQKMILKPLIEILAGIPSIVYGFFGMNILAPFLQNLFNIPIGLCILSAGLILGIMSLPTVCSLSEEALSYVPISFKEASFSLGANRWQTLIKVVIPAAGSGIWSAIILGLSRAIGETMVVVMVAGNSAIIPKSIFDPARTLTSAIALEMGETPFGSLHYQALFAIALILFIITFLFNILAEFISRRYRLKLGLAL